MDEFNFEFADGPADCDHCVNSRSLVYSGNEVMTSFLHGNPSANWSRNKEGDTPSSRSSRSSSLPSKSSPSVEGNTFYSIDDASVDSSSCTASASGNARVARPPDSLERNNNKSAVYAVTEAEVHSSATSADSFARSDAASATRYSAPGKDVSGGCVEDPGVVGECAQGEASGSNGLAARCKRQVFANAKTFSRDISSFSSSFSSQGRQQQPEWSNAPEEPPCLSRNSSEDDRHVTSAVPCPRDTDVTEEDFQTDAVCGSCPFQSGNGGSGGVRFGLDSPSSPDRSAEMPRATFMLTFGSSGMPTANNQARSSNDLCSLTSSAGHFSGEDSGAEQDKRPNGRSEADTQQNGKHTIKMRISKSLGTFFQKSPSKSSVIADMTDIQETCPEQSPVKSTTSKEPRRQTSLAGRVATSLAKLGRRGVFSKGTSSESPPGTDEGELYNNNKYTPVFVSPEDQVDVTDKAPVPLTDEQRKILKESWITIKRHVTEVGVETFMGLFNTHPESIDSFLAFKDKSVQDLERSAVLKAHALRVMQTVDKCITRLDKPDKMSALLYQLGKRHVDYQANIKLIPIIGKQFVSAIEPKMGASWSLEVKASWQGLFSIINYSMRQGLMDEKNSRLRAARDNEAAPRKKSDERRRREKKT